MGRNSVTGVLIHLLRGSCPVHYDLCHEDFPYVSKVEEKKVKVEEEVRGESGGWLGFL